MGVETTTLNYLRLNKAVAVRGHCSRRTADALIFAGRVAVNAQIEHNPARHISMQDEIALDGQILSDNPPSCYLMLNKPVQTVCTLHDPEGRLTVADCLPAQYKKLRLYPIGRLDYFSEGLLIMTNDGHLAHQMMHPRFHQPKLYSVLIRGKVKASALQTMRAGMCLAEGEHLLPVQVTAQKTNEGNTLLSMVLYQGVNRQIRRMCRDLQLTILRLIRLKQGPLHLGALKSGQARLLTKEEITALQHSLASDLNVARVR